MSERISKLISTQKLPISSSTSAPANSAKPASAKPTSSFKRSNQTSTARLKNQVQSSGNSAALGSELPLVPKTYTFKNPVKREDVYKGVSSPTNFVDPDMQDFANGLKMLEPQIRTGLQSTNKAQYEQATAWVNALLYRRYNEAAGWNGEGAIKRMFQAAFNTFNGFLHKPEGYPPSGKVSLQYAKSRMELANQDLRPQENPNLRKLNAKQAEFYAALRTLSANFGLYDDAAGGKMTLDNKTGMDDLLAAKGAQASPQTVFGARYIVDHPDIFATLADRDSNISLDSVNETINEIEDGTFDFQDVAL